MKNIRNILISLAVSLLVVSPVNAYTVKKGDTPFKIWGNNWQENLVKFGISDPKKLPVGLQVEVEGEKMLGISIPTTGALIDTYLATGIQKNDTEMTLANGTTRNGTVLSGYWCFTLDANTPTVEYVCGNVNGTSVTELVRGIDVLDPNISSSTYAYPHRRYATVQSSDYPQLTILSRILNGQETTPGGLTFATNSLSGLTLNPTDPTEAISLGYLTTVTTTGCANASETVRGCSELATAAEAASSTSIGSTGARLVLPASMASSTGGVATTTLPITNTSGKLNANFGGAASSLATLDANSLVVQNPANATSTATAGKIPIADSNGLINTWTTRTNLQNSFVAGEDITAGQPVYIARALGQYLVASSTTGTTQDNSGGANWNAQTFTSSANASSVTAVTFYLSGNGGSISGTMTVSVRAVSGGLPTGSDLGGTCTGTYTSIPNATTQTAVTATCVTPIAINPSTSYAVVVRISTSAGNASIYRSNTAGQGASNSSNSGSSWSAINGPMNYIIWEGRTAGRIYKTSAAVNNDAANNFIGFANTNITSSTSGLVDTNGLSTVLSGLTAGTQYYLGDTAGTVSSTAGTVSRKIGISASSTAMFIRLDNP